MTSEGCLLWWTGVGRSGSERRLTQEQRLERLGITPEDFETYKRLFLGFRRRDRYSVQRGDGAWPQVSHRWTDSLILRHLCGEENVAFEFAEIVDQIVLDIDYKGGRSRKEVEETVRSATSALPGEPLIYQSSESGGIRMVWFLMSAVSRLALCEWTHRMLTQAGVAVQSGKCEVRLGSAPDRLPFGSHSMLLDPVTLEPLCHLDLSQTLRVTVEHCRFHAVEPPALRPVVANPATDKERYKQLVAACLQMGLPADCSTNECLQVLAWYGRAQLRLDKDRVRTYLKDWIAKRHNDNSDRVNAGKIDSVYRQIDRIVDSLRALPGNPARASIEIVGLTESEVRNVLDLPGGFKSLSALFRLLSSAKASSLKQQVARKRNCVAGRVGGGTNKWGKVLDEIEDIPNRAKNFHLSVDLPKLFLRKLRVPNANYPARWVSEMERMGVLRLKRQAWPLAHIARQYWVNFPFDFEGQPAFDDFDQAVWSVLGYKGIVKRFSRYQAERVAQAVDSHKPKGDLLEKRPVTEPGGMTDRGCRVESC